MSKTEACTVDFSPKGNFLPSYIFSMKKQEPKMYSRRTQSQKTIIFTHCVCACKYEFVHSVYKKLILQPVNINLP